MATVCSFRGCPDLAIAGGRGRCGRHRLTTSARGYGAPHQHRRAVGLPGATCARCGCTRALQLNHKIPRSMGGTDDSANLEWLCDCSEHRCHSRFGVTSARAV